MSAEVVPNPDFWIFDFEPIYEHFFFFSEKIRQKSKNQFKKFLKPVLGRKHGPLKNSLRTFRISS